MKSPVQELLGKHIPSITDAIESDLNERISRAALSWGEPGDGDSADCALRVCHCGVIVDGFYEYHAHLADVLAKAGYEK